MPVNGYWERVTKPQIKNLIKTLGEVDIDLYPQGVNENDSSHIKLRYTMYEEEDIEHAITHWREATGKSRCWFAIWKEFERQEGV